MVYCGKPSKGCLPCRNKRTKCDLARPTCSQCLRAGRQCTGYRDLSDLIIRDQTQDVNFRHGSQSQGERSRRAAAQASSSYSNASSSSMTASGSGNSNASNLPEGLSPPVEDQALSFFFDNYVWCSSSQEPFNYLPAILRTGPMGVPLTNALIALGMAGLAFSRKDQSIMATAHQRYNTAVQMVHANLADPNEAQSDQTLLTITLLGLFEVNTCDSPRSRRAWTEHCNGAAAVLSLRGKQQLQREIGYRLFIQIRSLVINNCLQRNVAVPPTIVELSDFARTIEDPRQRVGTELSNICIRACNLKAQVFSADIPPNPELVMRSALAIDADFEAWINLHGASFPFEIISLEEPNEGIYGDNYHLYKSMKEAIGWNHYRCVRISVNELILTQLDILRNETAVLYNLTPGIPYFEIQPRTAFIEGFIIRLAEDICSSAPYFLEGGFENPQSTKNAAAGNLLLYPLYSAGSISNASPALISWVAGRLIYIWNEMGIQQAAIMAELINTGRSLDDWENE